MNLNICDKIMVRLLLNKFFCWNYITWLIYDIDKLDLHFIMLFHIISHGVGILCFYSDVIVNINSCIIYTGWSNELLSVILDMSLTELARMLCDRINCNIFEIKNEITLRMRIRLGLTCYVNVSIRSNENVNLIFGLASNNGCIF